MALHSVLSSSDQSLAFRVPPSGVRKIVIATNIAETGITIPDVVFVIDTGKVKETRYGLCYLKYIERDNTISLIYRVLATVPWLNQQSPTRTCPGSRWGDCLIIILIA